VNDLLGGIRIPAELDPESAARFDQVTDVLDEVATGHDVPVHLANAAVSLLYDYATDDTRGFLAARKDEVLAAAALHSAGMILEDPRRPWRPTLEDLARMFGVSTAAISTRSRAIRDLIMGPSGIERLLVDAIAAELRGLIPDGPGV
jgi:hypothetical protein